jgi:hypothetical protein
MEQKFAEKCKKRKQRKGGIKKPLFPISKNNGNYNSEIEVGRGIIF